MSFCEVCESNWTFSKKVKSGFNNFMSSKYPFGWGIVIIALVMLYFVDPYFAFGLPIAGAWMFGNMYVMRDRWYRCPECGEVFCPHCMREKGWKSGTPTCPNCEVALELL